MIDMEKVKGRAEQIKGQVEQAVGRATGSMETQARGVVGEAKGKALEAVADIKGAVKRGAGEAQAQLPEIRGKAKAALTGRNLTVAAIVVGVVVIVLAVYRVLSWSRRKA